MADQRDRLGLLQRSVDGLRRSVDEMGATVPADLEQLRQRLRVVEREARRLRNLVAIDQVHRIRWAQLESTLDPAAIHATIARALAEAVFEESPMPHVVLRNLWPADTYAALLDAIPPDEFFPEKDPIKQNIKIRQLEAVPAWTRRALEFLEDTVIATILTPALVSRMRPYLESVYRHEYGPALGPMVAAVPHLATAGRLMLRRPGYKLEPHLDPQRVAMTCLLYFARPGDDSAYGTELFEIDRPVVVDRSNTFYPREKGYDCRLVKAVPFEPNTALVFLNRTGAHAAEIPRNAPKHTKRYSYQFYVSPEPAALQGLMVDSVVRNQASGIMESS